MNWRIQHSGFREFNRPLRALKGWLASAVFLLAITAFGVPESAAPPIPVADEAAFFNLLDLTQPELAAVRRAVQARDWTEAKAAWATHLASRTAPRWLWSRRDKPAFQKIYDEQFGGLARYTNAANLVLARDFTLLGVRKQLAPQVQWLQGPIEWTHVLSRFGYWHDLGLAYWGTGNPAYAKDFVSLLTQWVQANPVPGEVSNSRGKNGSVWRTLEAGVRSQSWFESMETFMDAPEFDAEAKYLMTRSLVEHAHYLSAWLTVYRHGNWQVCESAGLATVGIMLPEFKASASWRAQGFKFLVDHMQQDVAPDGAHWELTPGYHTWVMNEFLGVSLLCKANGIQVPGLMSRHEKMFEFLEAICRPNRTYPPVGDAGIGTATIGDSMGRGALLYDRPDFRYLAGASCREDWLWLFGPEVCSQFEALASRPPAFNSVLLPDAKYAVMRTGWQPDDKYLLFDCAPWGSSHSHQDRLQISVFAGRDLIVDPGQCSYDYQPLARDLRLAEAHNVVMIDDEEPNIKINPELLAWHTDAQADFVCGRLGTNGLTQQRSVLFIKNPGYWVVVDHILGGGEHTVTRLFHFPIGPAQADGKAAHTAFTNGTNIRVQAMDDAALEMRTNLIPTGLVTAEPAPVAAFISRGKLPQTLCTVLLPYARVEDLPKVTSLPAQGLQPARLRLEFPDGQRDELVIGAESGPLVIGPHRANTRALCVRQGPVANDLISIPDGIGAASEVGPAVDGAH